MRSSFLGGSLLLLVFSSLPMSPQNDSYERHRQAAIRINDLAGRIHSEADANLYVGEIAGLFAKELPRSWRDGKLVGRVAHAEYETVANPSRLISEEHVANVWNQYVREIGAPNEALVTAAEIHNMRDGAFTVSQWMWSRGNQTLWSMPNVYAVGPDGKVADGCREVEALRVIHDLAYLFDNLRGARQRLRDGIVPSEEINKRESSPNPSPQATSRLVIHTSANPMLAAQQRYLQEHGQRSHDHLVARLLDELLPAD